MDLTVPQFVPQKVCVSCDGCCRFKDEQSLWRPKISADEIDSDLKLTDKIFAKDKLDTLKQLKAVVEKGVCRCVHFDLQANLCKIYEDHPFDCALYPFLLMRQEKEVFVGVHLNCPFIQNEYGRDAFEAFVLTLRGYFSQENIHKFLQRNLHLATDYHGFEDEIAVLFKVDL